MRVRTWKNPAWWFLLPSFAGVCIFYFIPYIDVFRRAFFSPAGGEFQGLDNFKTVLTNPAFQLAVKNTGLFMLVCIPLLLSLSLVIAVWIYRHSKIGNFLKTGFLLPMLFIIAVLALLNSFKVFREVYLVAGNYPNESIYMIQHLFNNWFRDLALDKMTAGAVLLSILLILLIFLLQKAWEDRA